jgi:SulP family sulfate permease
MAALVAIMIMVSIGTFSWSSIKNLREHPRSSSIVMLATVFVVVLTHNLAIGVLVGVLFSAVFFAWKISNLFSVTSTLTGGAGTAGESSGSARTYHVEGQLFFATTERFDRSFDFKEALEKVTIDVSNAHIWDISAVTALDMVVLKFRREGAEVELFGMNQASETLVAKLGVHDKPGALERLLGH